MRKEEEWSAAISLFGIANRSEDGDVTRSISSSASSSVPVRAVLAAAALAVAPAAACSGAAPATPSGQTLDVPVTPTPATTARASNCDLPDAPAPNAPLPEKEAYIESLVAKKECTQAYEGALVARFKGVKAVKADGKWMGTIEVTERLTRCSLASKACYAEIKPGQPIAEYESLWASMRASQKQGWPGIHVLKRGRQESDLQGAKPCADGGACEIPLGLVRLMQIKEPETAVIEVNAPRKKTEAEKQAEIDEAHRAHKAEVDACIAKCKDAKCKLACNTPPAATLVTPGF